MILFGVILTAHKVGVITLLSTFEERGLERLSELLLVTRLGDGAGVAAPIPKPLFSPTVLLSTLPLFQRKV